MNDGKIVSDWRSLSPLDWQRIKARGQIIALNGCFDPMEVHHCCLVQQVGAHGNVVIALNSDLSIERIKGRIPRRSFVERSLSLLALRSVVAVIGFYELSPDELYEALVPDAVARGHAKDGVEVISNYRGCPALIVPTIAGHSDVSLSSTYFQGRAIPHA